MEHPRQRKLIWPLALLLAINAILPSNKSHAGDQLQYTLTRSAAEQGDAEAQYELGKMRHDGKGAPQNYKEALTWLQRAAEQGHAKAQNELGSMLASGQGIKKNPHEAMIWYRKAAEQGLAEAQTNLGFMQASVDGIGRNEVSAYAWYSLAADQGYENAAKARDFTANRLTPEQRIQAIIQAAEIKATIDSHPSNSQ